jgi:hypothetical protein
MVTSLVIKTLACGDYCTPALVFDRVQATNPHWYAVAVNPSVVLTEWETEDEAKAR